MVYDAWRMNGGPTQHGPNKSAVTADVLEIGFVFAFGILFFCFALVIPGYKGISRLYFTIRIVISLFIGAAILLGVLGQEWESADLHTKTPYKAFANREITADVGMKIGLASVNITLKGDPVEQVLGGTNSTQFVETINYNERFNWYWRQGRFGFGPYAGRISREFRAAQYRGLPLPILWVAEYFTLDGELIRWGRSYRTAGWFTNEVLWTAFPLWIISNILTFMVLFYAGWLFVMTGGFMLVSCIIWASIRWGTQPLVIPFEDGALVTHYGPSFWLVISGGIVSVVYGLVIVGMDIWVPQKIADFFGNDVLQDSDEFFHKATNADDEEGAGSSVKGTGGVKARLHAVTSYKRNMTRRRKARENLHHELGVCRSFGDELTPAAGAVNGAYRDDYPSPAPRAHLYAPSDTVEEEAAPSDAGSTASARSDPPCYTSSGENDGAKTSVGASYHDVAV